MIFIDSILKLLLALDQLHEYKKRYEMESDYTCKIWTSQRRSLSGCTVYVRSVFLQYEGWNFNSGNYLFTTDTK